MFLKLRNSLYLFCVYNIIIVTNLRTVTFELLKKKIGGIHVFVNIIYLFTGIEDDSKFIVIRDSKYMYFTRRSRGK